MGTPQFQPLLCSILAPGGSADATDLVKGFLGRDYTFDAFEAWLSGD
jgi:thimet oligopeptidase